MTSPVLGSAVPWLFTEQVRPVQLRTNVGTGALLPVGSAIVTFCAADVFVTDHSSRTVRVTAKVPGAVKVFVGSGPVAVPCVPKFHEYVREFAFSSVESRPSNTHTFLSQE